MEKMGLQFHLPGSFFLAFPVVIILLVLPAVLIYVVSARSGLKMWAKILLIPACLIAPLLATLLWPLLIKVSGFLGATGGDGSVPYTVIASELLGDYSEYVWGGMTTILVLFIYRWSGRKKVKIELKDKNGNVVKKQVGKKDLDELVDKGLAVYGGLITAHVLDPSQGYYTTEWEVGEDVDPELVAKFAGPSRELYVLLAYERGEANGIIVKKEIWEKQRSIHEMIEAGEDEDVISVHMEKLKRTMQPEMMEIMKFWPFKRNAPRNPNAGEFDSTIWETNTLAKVALMPMVERFPDYGPIVDSDLVEVWDCLMTIAMTGVAVRTEGMLSDLQVQDEIKKVLDEMWQVGAELFDDYYEYTELRTKETGASWSGVSAMWVADNLRLHNKATTALKRNANKLDFVNRLSAFMNVSFGSTEGGFSPFLGLMALDAEKNMGIDMGLGLKGIKKDESKKVSILLHTYKSFAQKTVELIAEKEVLT